MISSFTGPHRFLSNFYPSVVELDGDLYLTVEHAFQAAKSLDPRERFVVREQINARDAKHVGRRVTLRSDWESIKVAVMWQLVRQKFAGLDLGTRLLQTQQHELVEGNTWGDTFWGVCAGHGQNMLGRILMHVRADLLLYRLAETHRQSTAPGVSRQTRAT